MKRNEIEHLIKWKSDEKRVPLYMTGVKGIGKTYLATEFAKKYFDSFFYFNLDNNSNIISLLENTENEAFFSVLAHYFEVPEELLQAGLLIFDEVYLSPSIIQKLLNLYLSYDPQHKSECFWILISSFDLLPIDRKKEVEELCLYPIQFDEYLSAIGHEWYVEVINAHFKSRKKIPDIVHQELLSTFDEYLWIGGMPDVINEYLTMESSINVTERQELQRMIIKNSMENISEDSISLKCKQVFSTIGEQLKKSNQRFQFNIIRKGITYQMYRNALDFLEQHKLAYRINELEKENQFKLYYTDFSLNQPACNTELTDVERSIRFQNYLIQTVKQKKLSCFFWESKSQASLDFVLSSSNLYIPIEVKMNQKNKQKSIASFKKEHSCGDTLRFTDSNFVENNDFINLPLYSAYCLINND